MELKKIYPFFISIIACVLFGWGVIYISLSGKADEIVESSVKERALKAQVALSKSLFKEINTIKGIKKVIDLVRLLQKYFFILFNFKIH